MIALLELWHATILEVIWLVMGLAALYLTSNNLRDVSKTLYAVELADVDPYEKQRLRVIAQGHFRNDLIRMMKSLNIVAAGLIAVIAPPITPTSQLTPVGAAVTIAIFNLALLLVVASFLDRRQRRMMARNGYEV